MVLINRLTSFPRLLLAGKPTAADIANLVVAIICSIASGVPFPLIAIIFGQLLNDFNAATCDVDSAAGTEAQQQHDVNQKVLLIVYLGIAQFVLIYAHLTCWSLHGARLAQRLREQYLQNLLRQEVAFFDEIPPGEAASRLNGDIQAIRSGTAEKVGICLSSLSFFVTAYVVAFMKDAKLAGMLVSLIPAYFLMSLVGSHYIEKYAGQMSEYAASAASIASEALSNIMIVQAFGARNRLQAAFTEQLRGSESAGLKKASAVGIQSGVLYFVAYAANGLAFWQGSEQIAHAVESGSNGVTVGAVFTVIFVLVEATLLLSQVAPFAHLLTAAVASSHKLHKEMERTPAIDNSGTSGQITTSVDGTIEFRDISFAYASRRDIPVLRHVSFRVPCKKHTAIVGQSGSGKSTIVSLLTRLYDPLSGSILLDGQNIQAINTRDLRGHIGVVQQEPALLHRSLLENIALGLLNSSRMEHVHLRPLLMSSKLAEIAAKLRSGADLAVVEQVEPQVAEIVALVRVAARLADAEDFILALPAGYGTMTGSSGRLISGGQKQRIALARALVKQPAVLILDEATSALDSASERNIQQAISNLPGERTIITIAHRLSTIARADNIIVIHKGCIVEQGDHIELSAKQGIYAGMISSQGKDNPQNVAVSRPEELRFQGRTNQGGTKTALITSDPNDEKDLTYQARSTQTETVDEALPAVPSKSLWTLVKGYSPAMRPHLLIIVIALVASSIVGGSFSAEAVIFGNTIEGLSPCKSADSVRSRGSLLALMFFVLAIIEFFANVVSWSGFGWVSEKVGFVVRTLSFQSLFEKDLGWHQSDGRTPAMLLSYITRDGDALAGLSGSVVGTLFAISINLIVAIVLTNIIAWKVAIVCLALVPLLLGAGFMELRILSKFEAQHESAYTKSVDLGVEAVTCIKTVATLSLEEEIMQTYRRSLLGPRKALLEVTVKASLCQAMTYLLGNLVNALAYWWGSKMIIAGDYTQTQFLIVVFSLLVSALLWTQMFALAPELTSARAALARILALIGTSLTDLKHHSKSSTTQNQDLESVVERKRSSLKGGQGSSVEFRNVRFAYPARPEIEVLKGLSMKIQPGQFCALVGPSGAGKSTIIALVERLYRPQSGSVLIDGLDVTKTLDHSFRDSIALVAQENVLFEGTVAFNVGLGARPGCEASMEEITTACRQANIHDVIEALPKGYETLCGTGGNQFSGGQRQRLAIARALVRKPTLLILDESTSALDPESERLVQKGLASATNEITVIAIAHRLHTIRRAHVIFLIEDGRCVDAGSHEELFDRSLAYRDNVLYQAVS